MVTLEAVVKCLQARGENLEIWLPQSSDPSSIFLSDITSDSRRVNDGTLFCCIRGVKDDGHKYVQEALFQGAKALLCESRLEARVPQIIVPSVRKVMGYPAAEIYKHPSQNMTMYAITGTNGKSTTAYMIRSILNASGEKTGILGTIIYSDGNREIKADRTTPESPDIQRWLAAMVKNGCRSCVMETSSHGLVQGRLGGCLFDNAVFTNLTPEHLDYHGSIKDYFEAKKKLFSDFAKKSFSGGVNVDDPYGRELYEILRPHVIPFGLEKVPEEGLSAEHIRMDMEGISFDLLLPGRQKVKDIFIPMTGKYNIYNGLASIAATYSMGISTDAVRSGFESLPKVPGRLEKYLFSNDVCCIIDYAHTPDALRNVLVTLREVTGNKLKVVFGLGGNRYQKNRPLMGQVAARYADEVTVTMDNPRDEDPADIASQILEGITQTVDRKCLERIILDREEAVRNTLSGAGAGDVVVVAGKGPETHIIWGNKRIPYNDTKTVLKWGKEKGLEWQ